MKKPQVTVLMAVYNGEKYLREAIDSILFQSFQDYEFLIIDDCSQDRSLEIISSYRDPRIRIIRNPSNLGLTRSLNIGVSLANGKYIARMDADDISLPSRLEVLTQYMEKNPDVGICGSWAYTIETKPKKLTPDCVPENIRIILFFNNILIHSSVIMRKSILDTFFLRYNEECLYAQDYNLWVKSAQYCTITNIPEVLLHYRISDTQVSSHRLFQQHISAMQTRVWQLHQMGIDVTPEEYDLHAYWMYVLCFKAESIYTKIKKTDIIITPEKILDWITKITVSNRRSGTYDQDIFEKYLIYYLLHGNFQKINDDQVIHNRRKKKLSRFWNRLQTALLD